MPIVCVRHSIFGAVHDGKECHISHARHPHAPPGGARHRRVSRIANPIRAEYPHRIGCWITCHFHVLVDESSWDT